MPYNFRGAPDSSERKKNKKDAVGFEVFAELGIEKILSLILEENEKTNRKYDLKNCKNKN